MDVCKIDNGQLLTTILFFGFLIVFFFWHLWFFIVNDYLKKKIKGTKVIQNGETIFDSEKKND